jgi:hypothetical protein
VAAAQAGGTLSIVDNELIAYEVATLTSANAYNLSGLARGLSGSSPAAHATGAPFARLDGAIVRYDLPANFIGQTLNFKFQSFNVFGSGLEDLSTCTAYPFTPIYPSTVVTSSPASALPAPSANPVAAQLLGGFPLDLGQVESTPTLADDFGSLAVTAGGSVDLGSLTIASAHPIAIALLSGAALDLGAVTGFASITDDFGSTNDPVVDLINLGTVP